jgi:NUMOD3 motif
VSAIFYVYEHWRPDLNQCFYVGKGSGMRGCYVGSTRPDEYHAITAYLSKLGLCPEVKILIGGLAEEEALAVEQARIKELIAAGVPIINVYHTAEYVNRLLTGARRGENHPNYGKHPSAETRAKMSKATLGKKKGPRSAETRAKQSAARKEYWARLTPEERVLTIAAMRATITPERLVALGKAGKGRKKTEETKRKMRESHIRLRDSKAPPTERLN